jgi:exonuclease SbcC
MRPIRLEIEGFTSFRQRVELDFSALELFAITGPTGAGKTSIIDALIYGLYGRTPRIGEKSASELITQGAERLTVVLEFSAGKDTYRLLRTLKRGSSAKLRLEKRIAGDNWEPLSDRAAGVKDEITKIVGLDFDGFTKAVVLPQGEFDKFLRGGAKERREILEELLRLDIYVKMGEFAREKDKELSAWKQMLEHDLTTIYAEATPEHKAAMERELEKLALDEDEVSSRLETIREAHPWATELRQLRKARSDNKNEMDRFQTKLSEAQIALENGEQKMRQHRSQIEDLENKIEKTGYDEKLYLDLAALIPLARQREDLQQVVADRNREMQERSQSLGPLERSLTDAIGRWEACQGGRQKAEQHLREVNGEYDAFRKQHGSVEVISGTLDEYRGIESNRRKSEQTEKMVEKLKSRRKALQEQVTQLAKEDEAAQTVLDEASLRLEHLQQLHAADELRGHLKKGQPCPVCEQIVKSMPTPGRKPTLASAKRAVAERKAAREQARERLANARSDLNSLPKEIQAKEETLETIQAAIAAVNNKVQGILGKPPGPETVVELANLSRRITELEGKVKLATKELEQARSAESGARDAVSQAERKRDLLRQKLQDIERDIAANSQKLQAVQAQRADWPMVSDLQKEQEAQTQAKQTKAKLEEQKKAAEDACHLAEQTHAAAKNSVENLTGRIQECEVRIQASKSEIEKLTVQFNKKLVGFELPEGPDETTRLEKMRSALDRKSHDLGSKIATTRTRLATIVKQIAEAEQKRKEAGDLQSRAELYRELGKTLKADQFIRFVLGEAIRRLATSGTKQLLMLSSSRYSFWTEGDEFLVIDHWNADETRSVNTLSGGESFLASLSLALALAESLSSFTSDPKQFALDSLFLDEGFSTLDVETMDVVVQGIEALAGNERLIGVISHVSELAERFPVRISVTKGIGGSTVSVT